MAHSAIQVLFICSWYPSRENEHLGNFIQRHAVAASAIARITVIAAVESDTDEIEERRTGEVREIISYYRKRLPFWSYHAALRKAHRIAASHTSFELAHVHVTYPAGYLATTLKLPYVVTEHFTGYLPSSGFQWSIWKKWIAQKVLKKATLVLPVSNNLGDGLQAFEPAVVYEKVSNVVQTQTFYPARELPQRFTFLHISTLNERTKNISGLLQAFQELHKKGVDFVLQIGGDGDLEELKQRIGKSGLPSSKVVVFGAQNSEGIAQLMRNANVFVLASHVENQPCVILEALCSGLPVVSTAAGGIHEEISDLNGLLVPTGDMDQLSNALYEVYTNYASYNRQSIAQTAAQNYSYEAVAEKLNTIYLNVLNADA